MLRRVCACTLMAASALASGCGHEPYVYTVAPAVGGGPAIPDETVALAVPEREPHGQIRVAVLGQTRLVRREQGLAIPALRARIVVANVDDRGPWTVDPDGLVAELGGRLRVPAALVAVDRLRQDEIAVAPGRSRVIDAYFPLGPPVVDADLRHVAIAVRVASPSGDVEVRAPFVRRVLVPDPKRAADRGAVLGHDYYDPLWEQPPGGSSEVPPPSVPGPIR